MAYKCLDCSYTSKKGFANGRCPGCDSANIVNTNRMKAEPRKKKRSPLETIIMIILWIIFIYGGYQHYYGGDEPFEEKTMNLDEFLPKHKK